jgi:hypothetical protein
MGHWLGRRGPDHPQQCQLQLDVQTMLASYVRWNRSSAAAHSSRETGYDEQHIYASIPHTLSDFLRQCSTLAEKQTFCPEQVCPRRDRSRTTLPANKCADSFGRHVLGGWTTQLLRLHGPGRH